MLLKEGEKLGQVTIFIIIAVIIVAIVGIVLLFRTYYSPVEKLPDNLEPVYDYFMTSCLEEGVLAGVQVLETQGGYIDLPEFEPGSTYMPFSSQLNFEGVNIPYWYYVSGNNIQKEQVPTRAKMEEQLANFLEDSASNCNFDFYYGQGFSINKGNADAKAVIKDNEVEVNIEMDLSISKDRESSAVKSHRVVLKTKLGELYNSALEVYDKEQKELFLEKYGVDSLRLYAPVDGVEFSCSPLTWNAEKVFDDLEESIEANTLSLKSQGKTDDYFVVKKLGGNVRFINSMSWSRGFEVEPSQGPLLIAMPVGNQPGLGILGFCYVDYHFVYNVKYPVLVQIYEGNEIFQFPIAVVILGNKERKPLDASGVQSEIPELCTYKNTIIEVGTYDLRNRPVDADISYDCAGTVCYMGKTENGRLATEFPQCVNGRVIAKAEGYEESKEIFSSVNPGRVNVLMDKLYPVNVNLRLDGRTYSGEAVISFVSNESTRTIVYPSQRTINLTSGEYEVQVYIYKNSTLKIGATTMEQCVDVPRGVLGIIGITKKKCFETTIPEQIISNALSGGGKQNYYVSNSQLENSRNVDIDTESLPVPDSLEQLQINYILFEERKFDINFR